MDAVLTFHSIDDSGSPLSYARDDLEALLDVLTEEGVRIVPFHELLDPTVEPGHRVALSFDDGIRSVHTVALPLLAQRRLPATLYVVAGWVGRTNGWPSQPRHAPCFPLMTWAELRDAVAAGFAVGSHSTSHRSLRRLNEADWELELVESRGRLEDALQEPVSHFAYPYGFHDLEAVRRVRALYASAVTTELGYLAGGDPHRLPRIDAHYLRRPRAPLFGTRSRCRLAIRGLLRQVRVATIATVP
jgi:peptidoglycan/xylan/chitin deacetylase (PgdA/CDA1 family)